MRGMGPPPKVFISYSHDSPEHEERVLDLADRLRGDGIDAEIDQYEPAPAEGWPAWCERQIEAADFVLMVCTETYHRRVQGREEPGKGLGVVYEARIIRQEIYDAGAVSRKFIPVLFSDGSLEHIPKPIRAWTHHVVDTDAGYEDLYRRLTGQPWVTRPIRGPIRHLPPRPRRGGEGSGGGTSAFTAASGAAVHWAQWPKLLNRGPQEAAIVERLETMARQHRDLEPLLVILPGCSGNCPGLFIERLSWHELQPWVGDERPPVFELQWPPPTTDPFAVVRDLRNRLNLDPRSVTGMTALAEKLGGFPQSFCFHHVIDEDAWRADGGALVRRWIDCFCREWPKPPPGHLVVAFLCIELPETPRGVTAWLRAVMRAPPPALALFVEELRQRAESEPWLVVAPPMEPICRRDVMSWVGRIRDHVGDPVLIEEIRRSCLDLFAEPHRRYRFEDAYRHLYDCLKTLMAADWPLVSR